MKKAHKIEIEVHGETETNLEIAFEIALERIGEGYRGGFNGEADGGYSFNVTVDEMPVRVELEDDDEAMDDEDFLNKLKVMK